MLEMESIGQSVESTATVALEDDANSSFTVYSLYELNNFVSLYHIMYLFFLL